MEIDLDVEYHKCPPSSSSSILHLKPGGRRNMYLILNAGWKFKYYKGQKRYVSQSIRILSQCQW